MKKFALAASAATLALAAARPRAVFAAPRADVSDPKVLLAELKKTFEDFKAKNDERLVQAEKRGEDAVTKDEVEKINATLGELQKSVEDVAAKAASAKLGDKTAPRDPEYTEQFNAYFKHGIESKKLEEVRAAATKTDGEGGYLAPIEWDRTLTGALKEVSPMRQHASVQQISGAGFRKLFSDRNIGSGWVGETAARPATTTPALTSLDFGLGELYANPAASQGLIDDAEVDIEQWLADEVKVEFDRQEGIAFLSGDGTNKPHGILTYVTGAANAARHPFGAITVVNSGHATQVMGDAVLTLQYALPSEYVANAKFFMNRGTAGAIRKLKDGQNNYLWQPSFALNQPATLAGEPIVDMPGMPAVGAAAIAILYGDMRETYQIVDRIGIRVLRDPYTNKPFVHFYTTKRVGGGVKNPVAMKAMAIAA
ncbi:MAG: phage major capsid protein [Allosphingosinicella sp.]